MLKLLINQIKTTVVPEFVTAVTSGTLGIFIAITSWRTEEKFRQEKWRHEMYKVRGSDYPISPYTFAILLAIAQNRYHYNKALDSYEVELPYLLGYRCSEELTTRQVEIIYVNSDLTTALISAEFPRRYIEHVTTGYGELPLDMEVKIRILDQLVI